MKNLEELLGRIAIKNKKTVAVAQATDLEVLHTVKSAIKQELCNFLLFGDKQNIERLAAEIDLHLITEFVSVVHVDSNEDAAVQAVKAVDNKVAQVLMKGNLPTKLLLKAVLNREFGLRTSNILSHVSLFEIPNHEKLIFLSDAAMNIAPTLNEKVQILNNVVEVARSLDIDHPKVAVLAAVETVNPAMIATTDGAKLKQMQQLGEIKDCLVDGPLAFDVAVSAKAAKQKKVDSEVAGQADVVLVPTIEVGNALYKSFIYFSKAKVAGVICGAKAPIVLTSRSDTSDSKLYSLSLALLSP
ncbi:bifunctional enoyl-CoA hydratase/phosphate acetyltransferase [Aquibacillus saliphilus]|uniref:bifunctional enoyl-CoA hydratase/phosphate acetyltransferase n=1 Tax=Aquibacillus saliphilus TaxID=1909422 RepID=UPI001CEFFD80|nr:bifunctional enoyl-CoA hydratase/phosphate acetyltransferase [Aquibacillus saliphilus]